MDTTVDEVADGIYRLSTFVPAANLPLADYYDDCLRQQLVDRPEIVGGAE